MPDDAYRFLRREDLERAVQVSDVLDEVIEAARPDPLRITVPAEIHRDGPTGQQGREQVEGAGVIEPAVQQQRELALAAFCGYALQTAWAAGGSAKRVATTALLVAIAALPTVAIDVFNSQDINNRARGPACCY